MNVTVITRMNHTILFLIAVILVKGKNFNKRPRERKPSKPRVPITKAMEEGREPMRTFGDLKQFYEKQTEPNQDSSGGQGQ